MNVSTSSEIFVEMGSKLYIPNLFKQINPSEGWGSIFGQKYNNERLELLENSTFSKFWQRGKLKYPSWDGDDLPQQFGHPHCFRHNKQHVLRPSKGWMVVGGTHVLPPGTRERAPRAASEPKRRCLSVVRLSVRPARQWGSGQSSP